MKLILPGELTTKTNTTDPILYYSRGLGLGWTFRRRVEMGLEMLPQEWTPASILEVGYGSGVVLYNLASIGAELHGLDLESDPHLVTARLGRLGVNARLIKGSLLDMQHLYEQGSFELVLCFSTLEHISEITKALEELYRVTANDGFLLLGMPAVNRFMDWAFRAIGIDNIAEHHVTPPAKLRECLRHQAIYGSFKHRQLPSYVPFPMALYHTFLLHKDPKRDIGSALVEA